MTNAEARFNKSLRPRKPEGSLGRTAQDVHLDSHTAPELCTPAEKTDSFFKALASEDIKQNVSFQSSEFKNCVKVEVAVLVFPS